MTTKEPTNHSEELNDALMGMKTTKELDHVTTKCKGETWEEAEERNNYFKKEGGIEILFEVNKLLDDYELRDLDLSGLRRKIKQLEKGK